MKENTLDWWGKYLVPKMNDFIVKYEDFLNWYSEKEAAVDGQNKTDDINHFRNLIGGLQKQKENCFVNIWKHTAVMKCLVCSSDYKQNFKLLRSRQIEMFISEQVCQKIQQDCTDFAM